MWGIAIQLKQGSPTSRPQPTSGLWGACNQAVEMVGKCMYVHVHPPFAYAGSENMHMRSICSSGGQVCMLLRQMKLHVHICRVLMQNHPLFPLWYFHRIDLATIWWSSKDSQKCYLCSKKSWFWLTFPTQTSVSRFKFLLYDCLTQWQKYAVSLHFN